jgi:RNA polymerase sigma-70 factor (ECF subfamily)
MHSITTESWPRIWQTLNGFADLVAPFFRFITGGSELQSFGGAKGNETPFIAMIREHNRMIHAEVCAYAKRPEDRQDLRQEIIIRLWQRYPTYRGESKASTWMFPVVHGAATARFKRKASIVDYTSDLPEHTYDEHFYENIDDRVFKILARLNDFQRAVLMLTAEGYVIEEIAKTCQVHVSKVKRAMRTVRIIAKNN